MIDGWECFDEWGDHADDVSPPSSHHPPLSERRGSGGVVTEADKDAALDAIGRFRDLVEAVLLKHGLRVCDMVTRDPDLETEILIIDEPGPAWFVPCEVAVAAQTADAVEALVLARTFRPA
jgi:hypothetical protein